MHVGLRASSEFISPDMRPSKGPYNLELNPNHYIIWKQTSLDLHRTNVKTL